MRKSKDFKASKMAFAYKYRTKALYAHIHPAMDITPDQAYTLLSRLARRGFSLIIPSIPTDFVYTDDFALRYADWFATLSHAAIEAGVKLALHPQRPLERALYEPSDCTQVLSRRTYYAEQHEHFVLNLYNKPTLSLIALDEEYSQIIDLRPYVHDGVLEFDVPDGNWVIEQYVCTETEQDGSQQLTHNRLSRTAFISYLDRLYVLCGGVQNTAISAISAIDSILLNDWLFIWSLCPFIMHEVRF